MPAVALPASVEQTSRGRSGVCARSDVCASGGMFSCPRASTQPTSSSSSSERSYRTDASETIGEGIAPPPPALHATEGCASDCSAAPGGDARRDTGEDDATGGRNTLETYARPCFGFAAGSFAAVEDASPGCGRLLRTARRSEADGPVPSPPPGSAATRTLALSPPPALDAPPLASAGSLLFIRKRR